LPADSKQSRDVLYSRIHPDDRLHVEKLLSEPMADDSEYIAEYRIPQEDGGADTCWRAAGRFTTREHRNAC
jgi:hypothetical protein